MRQVREDSVERAGISDVHGSDRADVALKANEFPFAFSQLEGCVAWRWTDCPRVDVKDSVGVVGRCVNFNRDVTAVYE